jgi:SAM-dependent methyltransferase
MWEGFARHAGEDGVLELACGTGRLLVPLARAGATLTGIDVSPAMLDVAREKVSRASQDGHVTLVEADMRAYDLGRQFGLVMVGLNSLMHLETRQSQREAIETAARHVRVGGRFVIDVFNPDDGLPDSAQEGQVYLHCLKVRTDQSQLLHFQSLSVDRGEQLVTVTNYYDDVDGDGLVRRHLAPFRLRYLAVGELELLVEQSGLRIEDLYGSYDLEPFRHGSPRIIIVGRRR